MFTPLLRFAYLIILNHFILFMIARGLMYGNMVSTLRIMYIHSRQPPIGLLRVSENMHGSCVTSRPEYSSGVLSLWLTMKKSRIAALCGPASCRICYFSEESKTRVIATLVTLRTSRLPSTILEIWRLQVLRSVSWQLRSLWSYQIFQEQRWKSPLKLTLCQH